MLALTVLLYGYIAVAVGSSVDYAVCCLDAAAAPCAPIALETAEKFSALDCYLADLSEKLSLFESCACCFALLLLLLLTKGNHSYDYSKWRRYLCALAAARASSPQHRSAPLSAAAASDS